MVGEELEITEVEKRPDPDLRRRTSGDRGATRLQPGQTSWATTATGPSTTRPTTTARPWSWTEGRQWGRSALRGSVRWNSWFENSYNQTVELQQLNWKKLNSNTWFETVELRELSWDSSIKTVELQVYQDRIITKKKVFNFSGKAKI